MNTYYIIAIVAVIAIAYFTFLSVYTKKKKEKQFNPFKEKHLNKELSEKQKQALSYGAILAFSRGEKIFNLIPNEIVEAYIQGLRNQWEIVDSESAKIRLSRLNSLATSSELDAVLGQDSSEINKIQKKIASVLKLDLDIVKEVKSTYAWDISRVIPLAKWCYWSGYLSEDEMWQNIYEAVSIAQEKGSDWTEYTISFLLGRTISGFDLDDLSIETEQVLNSKKVFLKYSDNIDLYKTYSFK